MAKWQCPYCGAESSIEPEARRRKAISGHLLNNHREQLNNIGTATVSTEPESEAGV